MVKQQKKTNIWFYYHLSLYLQRTNHHHAMRTIVSICFLLLTLLPAPGQTPDSVTSREQSLRKFETALYLGYASRTGNEAPWPFVRNRSKFELGVRPTFYFIPNLGVYAECNFAGAETFGPDVDPEGYEMDYDGCFHVLSMNASAGIEGRVALCRKLVAHARVGFGTSSGTSGGISRASDDAPSTAWEYSGVGWAPVINTGVTLEFRLKRKLRLFVDAGYRWPTRATNITFTRTDCTENIGSYEWSTRSWHRRAYVAIGILLP